MMTEQDVTVVKRPRDGDERPERLLAEQLVEQARADGVELVGPGGLNKPILKRAGGDLRGHPLSAYLRLA